MKNLSIAFLAAISLVSFAGCKKHGSGDAMAKMTDFKDKMCKCADKACADKVTEEMTKWGQEAAKAGADKQEKISEEETKKMASVTEEMTKCMTKAMMAGTGTPPAGDKAMAPAGDKPADPAAAAPPAGDKPADPAAAGSAAPAAPAGDKPAN